MPPRLLTTSTLGTTPGSYLYSLADGTLSSSGAYATIASDDSLVIFDATLKPLQNIRKAHEGISCLSAFSSSGSAQVFATAGRDGAVRCWDPRVKQRSGNSVSQLELSSPRGTGFSALATSPSDGRLIAAGTESTKEGLADVEVLVFDTRNPSSPVLRCAYAESHTDTITQLAFHPGTSRGGGGGVGEGQILLSGSEDGLVSLFDLQHVEEEDALSCVFNPRAGVHCAGFIDERRVYVVSADEQFSLYAIPEGADERDEASSLVLEAGDVRPLLDCTYVVDLLSPTSHSGLSAPIMAVGNHEQRRLQLIALDPSQNFAFAGKVDLPGAHGEEIVRDVLLREQEGRAFSCGEDGQVKVWDLAGALPMFGGAQGGDAMDIDM